MSPQTAKPPAIAVRNLSKKFRLYHRRPTEFKEHVMAWLKGRRFDYEVLWALRDVSMEVAPGETVGIVGANGSGKSTLLQVIAGIYTADEGKVEVNGRLRALLELGTGFNAELSGRENVFLNGALLGFRSADIRQRFDAIVDFAEIERFIDMPLKSYSTGMLVRLAFATAIHFDPEVLLLDEVLAVGDENFQKKCLERIETIRDGGATIVFVSHDLLTLQQLCDRAYLLESGRLVAEGPADEIVSRYRAALASGGASQASGKRWGSGEVRIRGVEIRDGAGALSRSLRTGQDVSIRIDFEALARVSRPVFGLAIRKEDGTLVSGPNTRMSGYEIEELEGAGSVEYRIARLPLLPGTYSVTCAVYDENLLNAYDHWENCAGFLVLEDGTRERFGVIALDARWSLTPTSERNEALRSPAP